MKMIGNFFIQPLDITYNKYEKYIYVAVEGNRVYKEFYAAIDTAIDGRVKIMVLAICKDGKIVTYINNAEDYDKLMEQSRSKLVYFTPIKLLTRDGKNMAFLDLFFRTHYNEKIEIKLYCIKKLYHKKPSIRKRESYFNQSKSTVFYSSKIIRTSSKSSVTIMGRDYSIQKVINLPFYNELQMLYVQDLGVINIYNKIREFKIISQPELICVGSKFVYECNGSQVVYTVEKMDDDLVFISSAKDKIVAKNIDRGLAIIKVFVTMHPEAPELTFNPPLSIIPNSEVDISKHKVALTMGTSTIMGDLTYTGNGEKGFVIKLVCDKIGWTDEEPLVTAVVFSDDGFKITTGIIENDVPEEI
ncbi:MAG: hypothetical protein RR806_00065 [Oscillospiraceae bacterium]